MCAALTLLGAVGHVGERAAVDRPRVPVAAFLEAFNAHSFANAADFAAPDWTLISPVGFESSGRDTVIQEYAMLDLAIFPGVSVTLKKQSLSTPRTPSRS